MGFLDNLRDRFSPKDDDWYDDDEDYGDDYYDDDDSSSRRAARDDGGSGSGILGNTRRPEAESVSVYTRSGRPVSGTSDVGTAAAGRDSDYDDAASRRASAERDYRYRDDERRRSWDDEPDEPDDVAQSHEGGFSGHGPTPGDVGLRAVPRPSSGQLPPYVLKPVSYEDVQMVVRRVRTNQPVVLALTNTNLEVARHILDFCFGLACGIDGEVQELGERVFVVVPKDVEISQSDIDKLVADGTIQKR